MSTFYLDYEGGNDANDGTSFANRWKTITNGATAARIAPGDTIRLMASPDPTSLGINGTWTDGGGQRRALCAISSSTNATPIVLTLSSGNYSLLNPAVGDTVSVIGHATNTNANGVWKVSAIDNVNFKVTLVNADGTNSVGNGTGSAGTIQNIKSCVVILASAVTQNIACIGNRGTLTNWTSDGGANVVCSIRTSEYKEGGECQQIAVGAGFTTGLAAHFATGTLDLSGYQQLSFWIKQVAGTTIVAGDISLRLCTDTGGVTNVHTFAVPALGTNDKWVQFTVDLATNLNSAIKSIALYVDTDRGAQTFYFDDIIAVKDHTSADSLSLTSMIGKNTGSEIFYPIMSINGVRVVIDRDGEYTQASDRMAGYFGTTETVTTYKRETIKTDVVTTSTTAVQTTQDSGTSGSPITFSGGWNRTDMSTQTGDTYWCGQNGFGRGLLVNKDYITIRHLSMIRYHQGIFWNTVPGGDLDYCYNSANSDTNLYLNTLSSFTGGNNLACYGSASQGCYIVSCTSPQIGGFLNLSNNKNYGLFIDNYLTYGCNIGSITHVSGCNLYNIFFNNGAFRNSIGTVSNAHCSASLGGLVLNGGDMYDNRILSYTSNYNEQYAVTSSPSGSRNFHIYGGSAVGNGLGTLTINVTASGFSDIYFHNFALTETVLSAGSPRDCRAYFNNLSGVSGVKDRIYTDGAQAQSQTTTVHGTSTYAWQITISATNRTAYYPFELLLTRFAVAANKLVTVKCWIRRDDTTSLVAKLTCKGGQLPGIPDDVTVTASGAIDTWKEETITFTPTAAGAVEIIAQVYGYDGTPPTTNAYYDDMTITQAA